MDAVALRATNPWLRDDNQYTHETVGSMPRSEFERRRELHLIYGTVDPDAEIDDEVAWGARALRDTSSLQNYMDQHYHPDDYELFNEPPRTKSTTTTTVAVLGSNTSAAVRTSSKAWTQPIR